MNIKWALTDDDKDYKKAKKELFYKSKPGEWRPDKFNELYRSDDLFENQCIILEKNGVREPENLTVFQFYKRLDFIKNANTKLR